MELFTNLKNLSDIIFSTAIDIRFIKRYRVTHDKKLLKKLNELLEISDWIDWEENTEYYYSNIIKWIGSIVDEDDKPS